MINIKLLIKDIALATVRIIVILLVFSTIAIGFVTFYSLILGILLWPFENF